MAFFTFSNTENNLVYPGGAINNLVQQKQLILRLQYVANPPFTSLENSARAEKMIRPGISGDIIFVSRFNLTASILHFNTINGSNDSILRSF